MTDLLTPETVRKMGDLSFPPTGERYRRLCRDYLTLWDELQNERSISDRLRQRIVEEEGPSK